MLSCQHETTGFFHYWTSKEAMLRAMGSGIAELEKIELNPIGKGIQSFSIAGCKQLSASWHIHFLSSKPNYFTSIAIKLPTMKLKY